MRFSVIIPSHNSEKFIRKGLDSIKNQSFADFELIVICDRCTDRTKEIAESYGAKTLEVDFGRDGLTRNTGLDVAQGEYVIFLDQDDWFLHEFVFSEIDKKLTSEGNPDMLVFSFIWHGIMYAKPINPRGEINIACWCKAFKRSFVKDARFSDVYSVSDLDFHKQVMAKNPRIVYWDSPCVFYNYLSEGSISKESGQTFEKTRKYFKADKGASDMTFSVIIPAHNEETRIGKCLESVYSQSYKNFECLVVCDACTDKTKEVAESYGARVIECDCHNEGLARNIGIANTTGDWILFIDADDHWLHEFVFQQLADRIVNNKADAICFDMVWKHIGVVSPISGRNGVLFPHCTNKCWRRRFLENFRFPDIHPDSDYYLHQEIVKHNPKWDIWRMPMYYYNFLCEGSQSAGLGRTAQDAIRVWNIK